MHPHTPTKQFDKFLKKYGFHHLKFHGLRHSSATYLLSNGCDIKTVSKRLGHTSIDTTNIYVHALEKTDKAAAECFDSIEVRSSSPSSACIGLSGFGEQFAVLFAQLDSPV